MIEECKMCKSKKLSVIHGHKVGWFYICRDCRYCDNEKISVNDINIILKEENNE